MLSCIIKFNEWLEHNPKRGETEEHRERNGRCLTWDSEKYFFNRLQIVTVDIISGRMSPC